MSAADNVAAAAQSAVTQQGKTVGDALQAYHTAQTAENARQELEMEKQNHAMNKATWVSGQMDKLSRMDDGPLKSKMLDVFGSQVKQVLPDFNSDNIDVLKHRPDLIPAARDSMARYANGADLTPDDMSNVGAWGAAHPTDQMAIWEKARQEKQQMMGNQLKSEGMMGRVSTMQDTATMGAIKSIHDDPTIKNGVAKGQAFDNDMQQLANKPNWQTFNEAMQNYGASLAGMKGNISDAKLHELQADLSGKKVGSWATFVSNNPGAAGNMASPEAVAWLQNKISEVNKLNDLQMGVAASRRAQVSSRFLHNPNITPALQDTARLYQSGGWRSIHPDYVAPSGGAATAPAAASPAPQPVNYGKTPKDVDKAYEEFLSEQAHKQAGAK